MPVSQSLMLQAVYDALFGAFTSPPVGAPTREGGLQADQTFLALNWPGSQIDPADVANPWSPNNTSGSMYATENLSVLVDKIPSVNPIYSPNGQNISDIYSLVVNAQVVPPPLDPAAKAAYDKAFHFLNAQTNSVSYDDNGAPITTKVWADSPVYANYKAKLKAYDQAVISMISAYGQLDMRKSADQRTWAMTGVTYADAVNSALADLRAAQDTKVQSMIATLAQSSNNQVGQLFSTARDQFQNIRYQSALNPGKTFHPASASPGNWFAPNAAANWTSITINSGSLQTSAHSDFTSYSTGGGAGWGLWSVGGSYSHQDSHESMSQDTNNLKVSFKYARVDIVRPWLNFLLFNVGGWNLGKAFGPGGLSNGKKAQAPNSPFPLLPTSFIAVRDVQISANWGHEDSSLITSKTSSSASFGWGPFSVSGSYSSGSSDKKFNSQFDGVTISNPGLQIVGWVNTVVPDSPPLGAPAAQHAGAHG
jgi:hypothetical protein